MTDDYTAPIEQLISDALDTGQGIAHLWMDGGGAELSLAYDAQKGFFLVVVPDDQQNAQAGQTLAGAASALVQQGFCALSNDGGKTHLYENAELRPVAAKAPPNVQAPSIWHAFEYRFDQRPRRPPSAVRGRARNLRCPCGGGRKYKRCCGRSGRP